MKGYLKSNDGIFQLAPKVTTIGREGCDLVIQSTGVDYQHAVIEFSPEQQGFVLQDLNTVLGTFVNDCRVQNAAVRLAANDIIRFGASNVTYDFMLDDGDQYQFIRQSQNQVSIPPVHQRMAWGNQPLTILTDRAPSPVIIQDSLPQLQSVIKTTQSRWENSNNGPYPPVPRPPVSTRSRPLSANNVGVRRIPNGSPPVQHRTITGTSGWVSVGGQSRAQGDINAAQEKEQRLLRLQEEVRRLAMFESESNRKESIIQTLREEIADLQGRLRHLETSQGTLAVSDDNHLIQRIMTLEQQVEYKNQEVAILTEQIASAPPLTPPSGGNSQELNDRIREINSLKTELERTKKDKNITSGLVSQMQKDMTAKDTTISRLTRDTESLKEEMKDKDAGLVSMQAKFKKTEESRKSTEEVEARDKELAVLRMKFKSTESQLQEQQELVSGLRQEIEKIKTEGVEEKESQKKVQSEMDLVKAKCLDIERAERAVRVELEQTSKKLERFRSRIIQTTFSTPGIKAPDGQINDDELIESLKSVVDERTTFLKRVQDLNENINMSSSSKKEQEQNTKKLKQQINESMARFREKGMKSGVIKQELDFLSCLSLDQSSEWVKEGVMNLGRLIGDWVADIEGALEECGINVKLMDEPPRIHIFYLREKGKELMADKEALMEQLTSADERFKADLETSLANLRQELEDKMKDEVEKTRLEGEEKLNKAIEQMRVEEDEKRENAVTVEKEKIAALEASNEAMKTTLLEREDEDTSNKDTTKEALEQLEEYKKLELTLKEQIRELESKDTDSSETYMKQLEEKDKKYEIDVTRYKEEVRQHSVTICAMEERFHKIMKKNKDTQVEMAHLKQTITELQNRRPVTPKTKVLIQQPGPNLIALETTISELRRENAALKKTVAEHEGVVVGLRRDLMGASARLTDITGELSESQKEDLEKHKMAARLKEAELLEARQQMAKLSQIIDKRADEVKELNSEIVRHKTAAAKYLNLANEKESTVQELEEQLSVTSKSQTDKLSALEEEGRITSEMSALGAQCRGERHEQTIIRQREALTELRNRIRMLEQTRPQGAGGDKTYQMPNHDQALQQVVLLKKELAEFKAQQATQNISRTSGIDVSLLQDQIAKARAAPGGPPTQQDAALIDMERSAHRETVESLELSESSYLDLLRGLASSLEMDELSGMHSISNIPRDERHLLIRQRETVSEALASRIKVLKERIVRKDELLQGYERDLHKLRQAEQLAEHRNVQVESLSTDVRSRVEETQYLRESLQRTRDKLDQEKRLNTAIKSKKTFHLENERPTETRFKKPHCEIEDVLGKGDTRKKHQADRIKRKNYEIKVLKGELGNRDREMTDAQRRLAMLEGSSSNSSRRQKIIEAP